MSGWTAADGAALPPHAARKLDSRAWRWRTSWWILPPLVSLGVLCWVGFLWAGIKTAKPKYYVSGGIWLVISLLVIVLPPGGHTAIIAMACFSLATAQAVVMNRRYLIERAVLDL